MRKHKVHSGAFFIRICEFLCCVCSCRSPEAEKEESHQPGICPGFVRNVRHDLLLAGGAGGHARIKTQRCVVTGQLFFAIAVEA